MSALRLDIAKEAANVTALKRELLVTRGEAKALARKAADLSSEVDRTNQDLAAERSNLESEKTKSDAIEATLEQEKARKPPVPVRIEIRRSAMGRGLVAMFTNTSAM